MSVHPQTIFPVKYATRNDRDQSAPSNRCPNGLRNRVLRCHHGFQQEPGSYLCPICKKPELDKKALEEQIVSEIRNGAKSLSDLCKVIPIHAKTINAVLANMRKRRKLVKWELQS